MKELKSVSDLEEYSGLKPFRAAFFDIDGTISGARGISDETVRELKQLKAEGAAVCLASGRPYFGAREIINKLGITDPCLFFSGALVIVPPRGEILFESALTSDELNRVLAFIHRHGVYCELYTAEHYYIERPHRYGELHAEYLGLQPRVRAFSSLCAEEKILKIVLIVQRGEEQAIIDRMRDEFSELNFGIGYGAAHPDIVFANLTSRAATRQQAFEVIGSYLDISPLECVAFGDAEADLPFLELAGLGVAMGNSPESVKLQADIVTKSVEEEGVPFALKIFRQFFAARRWES